MAYFNKTIMIGRLTADPEPPRKVGQGNKFVVKFRFAVGRSKKNPQTGQWENDPHPCYIDCEAWIQDNGNGVGKVISDYARKGSELQIEGRLAFDQWDDKNSPGTMRSKHKIVVDGVQLLGKAPDGSGGGGNQSGGGNQGQNTGGGGGGYNADSPPDDGGGDDSDIPF